MKKLAIVFLFGLSTSLIYAEGSFSVQNDVDSANGVSYYIHLGPNGGPSGISIQDNPDNDSWYLDGAFASKGNQAHYHITSPDNFKQPTNTATDVPAYQNFQYNTSANLDIYIYDNQNDIVTTCPVKNVYYRNHGQVAISQDIQTCNNPQYAVEDDQGSIFHPGTLYVHSIYNVLVGITNKLPSGYTIDLGSNDNITMGNNPDNNVWAVNKPKASSGQSANYTVGSYDNFNLSSTNGSNGSYNSQAQIKFDVYNNQNKLVATCSTDAFFYDKIAGEYPCISFYMKNQYVACSNSNFYITGITRPDYGFTKQFLTINTLQDT